MDQPNPVRLRVAKELHREFEALCTPVLGATMVRRDSSPEYPGDYSYLLDLPGGPEQADHIDVVWHKEWLRPGSAPIVTAQSVLWYDQHGRLLATTTPGERSSGSPT